MSGGQGHGAGVDLESVRAALQPTRRLRLALDVLTEDLPPDLETDAISKALWELHENLAKTETAQLRTYGLSQDYLIVRPINPINPPAPDTMREITTALKTLAGHGLLVVP